MVYNQIVTGLNEVWSGGFFDGMIVFWIISAAGRALPPTKETSSDFYLWFYQFTQILLANFELLMAKKGGSRAPSV